MVAYGQRSAQGAFLRRVPYLPASLSIRHSVLLRRPYRH